MVTRRWSQEGGHKKVVTRRWSQEGMATNTKQAVENEVALIPKTTPTVAEQFNVFQEDVPCKANYLRALLTKTSTSYLTHNLYVF